MLPGKGTIHRLGSTLARRRDNPESSYLAMHSKVHSAAPAVPDAFDQVIAEQPGVSVLVSLIGLPADPLACTFWGKGAGPPLVLLLPDLWMIGDGGAIRQAFHSGRILAAVVRRPKGWSVAEGADAFDEHYLLVTAGNIDEVVEHLPGVGTRRR